MSGTLRDLQREVARFRDERGWQKFHDPANLAAAISVEAAELLGIFLWTKAEASFGRAVEAREEIAGELADIVLFVANLANAVEIDLETAISNKLAVNAERFPIDEHGASPPARDR